MQTPLILGCWLLVLTPELFLCTMHAPLLHQDLCLDWLSDSQSSLMGAISKQAVIRYLD